jgi:DNA invertase Pin-like site-specific DNA recombinase
MSKGQRVGYKRVSTTDQTTARQLDGIELDRVFEDSCSGKTTNRPALQEALLYLRADDRLIVHSIDRLARNTKDLLDLVELLTGKGVTVEFVKENMTFSTGVNDHMAKLMMTMLAAFADFERSIIRERQLEGIALAKKDGKYKGRAPKLNNKQVATLRERVAAGEEKAAVARDFRISRVSLYRYLADA